MTLTELKTHMLDDSAQVIVFRKSDGRVINSCNRLSNVEAWKGRSLYDFVPLIKSMEMVWNHMEDETVDLPCVDFILEQRQGYYDFLFRLHPEHPELIVWLIKDQTRIYRYYQGIQQQRNEMLLNQRDKLA